MKNGKLKSIVWEKNYVKFIDQKSLPEKLDFIITTDYREIIKAIKELKIRGAPLIGISAAYGIALAVKEAENSNIKNHYVWLDKVINEFSLSRPTAVNLFFALDKMKALIKKFPDKTSKQLFKIILKEAHDICKEDEIMCKKIGENGAELIGNDFHILTYCNTGMLVTSGIGTALGVVITAKKQGKNIKLYANETRPLMQGARLTAWEGLKNNIETTLICDNMSGYLMKSGIIDCTIVGADRIAANGDTANKIGTYSLAILCKAHNVPFYVAAPFSTFDLTLETGNEIPIEERNKEEIVKYKGVVTAPEEVNVINPAFDVTPAELISAIITDRGIYKHPYGKW